MSASHTPGPWRLAENEVGWQSQVCGDWNERVIAQCEGYAMEQCEANARLIALAPEMLEMLEMLCGAMYAQEFDALVAKTLDLIERAKGDTNG